MYIAQPLHTQHQTYNDSDRVTAFASLADNTAVTINNIELVTVGSFRNMPISIPFPLTRATATNGSGTASERVRARKGAATAAILRVAALRHAKRRESYRAFPLDAICVSRADALCPGSTVSESAIVAQLVPAAEIHWS